MGRITPIGVTRSGEYVMDIEQHAADEVQYQKDLRADLIHARTNEIQAKRMKELSLDDLALALDVLSTAAFVSQRASLRTSLLTRDEQLVPMLLGMIEGVLISDSIDKTLKEFSTLDAQKAGDLH